jgi:hypothetical protein
MRDPFVLKWRSTCTTIEKFFQDRRSPPETGDAANEGWLLTVETNRMRAALAASLLLAAPLPAAAQPAEPAAAPWSVESPGSLGARFGLGFDLLLDRFDDIEAVAGRQTVTVRGADGGEETTVVPFDPRLDDRKHGRDWEERSVGVQVPIALPRLPLGRGLSIEPSLVLEAAAVDGRFTVHDLVEGQADRTLDGTGARWGVGVQALGGLCRDCRWFWGAGYRYRTLAGLDIGSDTRPDPAGLTVTETTEIDHDTHHLTARLGARLAGGRAAAYVGVRSRRSDLVLDDETTLASPQRREETTVATRLELDGDDTAAIAGVDFRLGRGTVARVEASFGGDGESVLFKVVGFPGGRPPPPPPVPSLVDPSPPRIETPEEIAEQRRRAEQLADDVAPRVAALRQLFHERVQQLERAAGPGRALDREAVLALVADVEAELRSILAAPELQPVLAVAVELAERSRRALGGRQAAAVGGQPARPRPAEPYRLAAYSPAPQPPPESAQADPSRGVLAEIGGFLDRLFRRTDERRLTQPLCVRSEPTAGALVALSAALPGSRVIEQRTEGKLNVVYRGTYAYQARLGDRVIACPADSDPADCSFIDLWTSDDPFLVCDFSRGIERCLQRPGDPGTCGQ